MGYFSNGTEGDDYEHNVCSRCAHYQEPEDGTCAVWMVHLLYNYAKEGSEAESILGELIPRHGVYNGLCAMWYPAKPEWVEHGKQYREWLERLEAK